ncbi:MAG: PaaI family thioesterase [Streptococcaceae bacterium]|jgi:uncharacterized protein (TIGR00369 family)|nr:PaaI family thioesterase [Streptococcaceae bacterium]
MTLIDELGIQHFEVLEGKFRAEMALSSWHAQPQGYLNGGATLAFAEVAAGMASHELLGEGEFAVGQAISAVHVNPMKAEGVLIAEGELLKAGKRSQTWDIRMKNEAGTVISKITVTNAIVRRDHA